MSDTLRTDALISRHTEESMRLITTSDHQLVSHALRQTRELIEHARELERECAECEAAISELIALRAAKVDAVRYQWLRNPLSDVYAAYQPRGDYGKGLKTGMALDAAIDSALAKERAK